ncbi:DUF58 domain-containing protein [Candidatus Woesearchaeota archaeon]|nr:DUF58 domain-containing protein [Candidatus Woesearchaeota archaeon]
MKRKLNVDIVPSIRRLEIVTKGLLKTKVSGNYRSVFKGRGLEFSEYRPYCSGDDASMIDWKATLRTNQILVRQYVEEKEVSVFFLIDCSDSMVFGSTVKLKNEYTVELVASLAYAILEAEDSVGMAMFNDKIVSKIYPAKGRSQFHVLEKALLNPDYYFGAYDFNNAAKFLLNFLKEDSVVIIVSDFVGLKDGWVKFLEIVSHKFDTIAIMVRDPRDKVLPEDAGQVVIQDPYSKRSLLIEPELIREVYEAEMKKQENEIRNAFLRNRADFLSLTTDKGFTKPVLNLFMERSLRWR